MKRNIRNTERERTNNKETTVSAGVLAGFGREVWSFGFWIWGLSPEYPNSRDRNLVQ